MQAEKSFSLKDQLFNPAKIEGLASEISSAYPAFEQQAFINVIVDALPELELKQRITFIAKQIHQFLPNPYPDALDIVLRALPPELDPTKRDDDFGDFIHAPYGEFVAMFGCTAEHLDQSLSGLREITKRFSVEGPIREFINHFPAETLHFLTACAQSDNYHVRRLASEGTRPKLPWAPKLIIDFHEALPILDLLYADTTRYVTRSVANHLNDIAKIDPPLVVATLAKWRDAGEQDEKEMGFIMRHGLRTLIKTGDPAALDILGFGAVPELEGLALTTSTPSVVLGTPFQFLLEFKSLAEQSLMIDYVMHFAPEAAGKRSGRKVFKLKQLQVNAGETVSIKKKHPMKLMTTRRLFPGEHTIELQINGTSWGRLSFDLAAAEI